MAYLKHNVTNGTKRPKKSDRKPSEPLKLMLETDPNGIQPTADSVAHRGLSEIAEQLERIHCSLRSYNINATAGENSLNIFTGQDSYPVKVIVDFATDDEGRTIAERAVTGLERLADAVAKLAGFNSLYSLEWEDETLRQLDEGKS